ncbi:MAG: ribosome biogenesis GTP-binding protein YihA/YsxC [Saprospiraceae bacterium]
MNFSKVEYVASFPKVSQCPVSDMPEFAFLGRSNVGKSSLINMLTERKALAKVSNTPGKTQLINFFNINDLWFLVDLPGYGYAKVSKVKKQLFSKMILDYILKREKLVCCFLLLDLRLPLQKIDHEFITWLGENGIAFVIVFTKADKLTKIQLKNNLNDINKTLLEEWVSLPTQFITSAETRLGKEDILKYIQELTRS